MNSDEDTQTLNMRIRKIIITILGALLLGAAGSGLWELFFRPGLSKFGRFTLNLMTLGSSKLKDYAYEMAALDPTPLPSLSLLLIVALLPFFAFSSYFGFRAGRWHSQREYEKIINKEDKETADKIIEQKILFNRRMLDITMIFVFVLGIYASIATRVLNQSIFISRVFHANMAICGPFITEKQEKELKGKFASMKAKKDFDPINNDLRRLAQSSNVKLLEVELW